MDILKSNINNLTHLWKIVSSSFQTYFEKDNYSYCYIHNSQWPNRIWTNTQLNAMVLNDIANEIKTNQSNINFSFFNTANPLDNELLKSLQFTEIGIQYGMSKPLDKKYELNNKLAFLKVEGKEEIQQWCKAFEKSFNYQISEETLARNFNKTDFYLIYSEGDIAGTIILHLTKDIAGIHALGIIPEMRSKGIAREAMKKIINISIGLNAKHTVLQASEMARKMYESMGFTTQFSMHNYQLNTK